MQDDQKIRIVCGPPAAMEVVVNELLNNYAPIVWNIQPGKDGPLVTCILVSERELRKAQILAAGMPPARTV